MIVLMVVVVLKTPIFGINSGAEIDSDADDTQGVGLRIHREEQDLWLAGSHPDSSKVGSVCSQV